MDRLTLLTTTDIYEQNVYRLKNKDDNETQYLVNKLGEYEDFIQAIISFYNMNKEITLTEILEKLFVFKTSYVNLTNSYDKLTTKYRDLLKVRERDESIIYSERDN
jgi:hypothetical protein